MSGKHHSHHSRHCQPRDRCGRVDLIRTKTPCSHDGARANGTLLSCIAKSVSGDILAVRRCCELTSLTCALPPQMALSLALAKSVRQPSRPGRYVGCSHESAMNVKKRYET